MDMRRYDRGMTRTRLSTTVDGELWSCEPRMREICTALAVATDCR